MQARGRRRSSARFDEVLRRRLADEVHQRRRCTRGDELRYGRRAAAATATRRARPRARAPRTCARATSAPQAAARDYGVASRLGSAMTGALGRARALSGTTPTSQLPGLRPADPARRLGLRRRRRRRAARLRARVRGALLRLRRADVRSARRTMMITEVEAILLRQPGAVDSAIADGSQDALIVRVHTDEGIVGHRRGRLAPARGQGGHRGAGGAHRSRTACAALLVGEDPLDIERLWERMYRGSIYYGRRGVVDARDQRHRHRALGHRRARPPASRSTRCSAARSGERAQGLREHADARHAGRGGGASSPSSASAGFRAVKLGWGRSGATPTSTSRWSPPRARPPATTST